MTPLSIGIILVFIEYAAIFALVFYLCDDLKLLLKKVVEKVVERSDEVEPISLVSKEDLAEAIGEADHFLILPVSDLSVMKEVFEIAACFFPKNSKQGIVAEDLYSRLLSMEKGDTDPRKTEGRRTT